MKKVTSSTTRTRQTPTTSIRSTSTSTKVAKTTSRPTKTTSRPTTSTGFTSTTTPTTTSSLLQKNEVISLKPLPNLSTGASFPFSYINLSNLCEIEPEKDSDLFFYFPTYYEDLGLNVTQIGQIFKKM